VVEIMTTESEPAVFARRLYEAYRNGTPATVEPFANISIATGYEVQREFVSARIDDEGPAVGYKLGFTNEEIQREIGVPEPVYGRLLAATVGVGEVDLGALIDPRGEPEIVVCLGESVPPSPSREQVANAVESVAPAIEIVDTRTGSWDLPPGVAVADNALAARLVTGPERPLADCPPLADIEVTVTTPAGDWTGHGAAVLGDPIEAVAWLARTRDQSLPANTLVSTGSLTSTVPLRPGDRVTASFSSLGEVMVQPAES
jgi:2-keto-4-pentenoate hydratase